MSLAKYRLFNIAASVNLFVAGIAFGRGEVAAAIAFGVAYVVFSATSMVAYDRHHGIGAA